MQIQNSPNQIPADFCGHWQPDPKVRVKVRRTWTSGSDFGGRSWSTQAPARSADKPRCEGVKAAVQTDRQERTQSPEEARSPVDNWLPTKMRSSSVQTVVLSTMRWNNWIHTGKTMDLTHILQKSNHSLKDKTYQRKTSRKRAREKSLWPWVRQRLLGYDTKDVIT